MVCLRNSDPSQGLSVMRLDMETINSFCLDGGVRKILLMNVRLSLLMRDISIMYISNESNEDSLMSFEEPLRVCTY